MTSGYSATVPPGMAVRVGVVVPNRAQRRATPHGPCWEKSQPGSRKVAPDSSPHAQIGMNPEPGTSLEFTSSRIALNFVMCVN